MTMRADEEQWSNLRQFWNSREGKEKVQLTMEKSDVLLKGIVKRFFNEKEVTSTLVMDALYCGCRALDIGEEDFVPALRAHRAAIDATRSPQRQLAKEFILNSDADTDFAYPWWQPMIMAFLAILFCEHFWAMISSFM